MNETDNFNLAGYLRKNTLMESFEGFGGYRDLKPLKEDEGEQGDVNAWMEEVDGTEAYAVGEWNCYYDHPGVLAWSYSDIPFDKFSVYATPGWEDPNSTPIQVEVNQDTQSNMSLAQGAFADFSEYAAAMEPMLKKIESEFSDDMTDGEITNEADDSFIQAQRDAVGAKGADDDSYDNQDRMMDLGGEQIEKGIMFLLDDGFDSEDVLDMCKMFIDAHSEASAQGKKF